MEENKYPILDKIHTDAELKALSDADAKALCAELRCFLVDKVTKSGGHLASNLGAVEISVAVHRIFDLPHDRVIVDVGHQSYVHKILSGRRDFDTLRKPGGLSGFEKMDESEYDAFGTGMPPRRSPPRSAMPRRTNSQGATITRSSSLGTARSPAVWCMRR